MQQCRVIITGLHERKQQYFLIQLFRNIEELQEQNQRLLATVRQLSEDQERLEQEGGHEV